MYSVIHQIKLHLDLLKRLAFVQRNGVWELKLRDPTVNVIYQNGQLEIYSNSVNALGIVAEKLGISRDKQNITFVMPKHNEQGGVVFQKLGTLQIQEAPSPPPQKTSG